MRVTRCGFIAQRLSNHWAVPFPETVHSLKNALEKSGLPEFARIYPWQLLNYVSPEQGGRSGGLLDEVRQPAAVFDIALELFTGFFLWVIIGSGCVVKYRGNVRFNGEEPAIATS